MLDFSTLQTSSEHPTAWAILLTVLFSFALSCLIVLTYDLTTKALNRPYHYLQSLTLISILAAMVMSAVGDSLARGLGMLGALAIIRFRTTLRNPRNMTFMFASLAVGIACGVQGYIIAVIGTMVFCLGAFILKFSPFNGGKDLIGNLRIELPPESDAKEILNRTLKKYCNGFEIRQYQIRPEKMIIHYNIKMNKNKPAWELTKALNEINEVINVRLAFTSPAVEL